MPERLKQYVETRIKEMKKEIENLGQLCPCGCQNETHDWYKTKLETYQDVLRVIKILEANEPVSVE